MFQPIFSHMTYLGRFNQNEVLTIQGSHHCLSFAKISEKGIDKFLNK